MRIFQTVLLFYMMLLCSCQWGGIRPKQAAVDSTHPSFRLPPVPEDTLLDRLSVIIRMLNTTSWDSTIINNIITDLGKQYYVSLNHATRDSMPTEAVDFYTSYNSPDEPFDIEMIAAPPLQGNITQQDLEARFGKKFVAAGNGGSTPTVALPKDAPDEYRVSSGQLAVRIRVQPLLFQKQQPYGIFVLSLRRN